MESKQVMVHFIDGGKNNELFGSTTMLLKTTQIIDELQEKLNSKKIYATIFSRRINYLPEI